MKTLKLHHPKASGGWVLESILFSHHRSEFRLKAHPAPECLPPGREATVGKGKLRSPLNAVTWETARVGR